METIKEMAKEYAYTNWQSDDYHDGAAQGMPFDAIGHTEKTYLAGANAVLDKIEKAILVSSVRPNMQHVFDVIKELKDE